MATKKIRVYELARELGVDNAVVLDLDRKSTRLNSSHSQISYAVFCLKKKKKTHTHSYTIITIRKHNSLNASICGVSTIFYQYLALLHSCVCLRAAVTCRTHTPQHVVA